MAKGDLAYHNRATSHPSYAKITPYALSSELFLPSHLQLGPNNWLEFKLAVETVLRVKGLPLTHLKYPECPRALAADKDERERWGADDELCKTIIVLNVRSDHVRFAELEHEQWTAADVWGMLVQRDLEIRDGVRERWDRLVKVYVGLMGVGYVLSATIVALLWRWWVEAVQRAEAHTFQPFPH
ncbi:hypothetical protein C8Q77DRAFT_1178948 [Trametes polyzona]|nr:hypothetical protein C8Q77DRAFT_1178948 [Trametes polyzona]